MQARMPYPGMVPQYGNMMMMQQHQSMMAA